MKTFKGISMSSLKSVLAITVLALLLSACGGESTEQLPNTSQNSGTVTYNGPAPSTDDVANFKRTVWRVTAPMARHPRSSMSRTLTWLTHRRILLLTCLIHPSPQW